MHSGARRNSVKFLWLLVLCVLFVSACQQQGFVRSTARNTVPPEAPPLAAPQPAEKPKFVEKPEPAKKPEQKVTNSTKPGNQSFDVERVPDAQPTATTQASTLATKKWCRALADRLFSVSTNQCLNRGYVASEHLSVQGRTIAVRDTHPAQQPGIGRVLLIGGTHGDELTSVSLVFWWMDMLEAESSNIKWRVAPLMNPDGLMHSPARRVNANNVDLNRNLPTPKWETQSRTYWWETGNEPRRFPGDTAASEPETRWLVDTVASFKPDVIISLHAPYGVLDYDGEYPPPPRLGELELNQLGVFPGSLGNYGSRFLGIPVMTVELDHATRMPSQQQARVMWQDLNAWLQSYLLSKRKVSAAAQQSDG